MILSHGWYLPDQEIYLLEHLQREYKKRGHFDIQLDQRKKSISYCRLRRVAVDVGAHVGFWAKDLAKNFDTVVSFEPLASCRECFLANVSANNTMLYPYALGNHQQHTRLIVNPSSSGETYISPCESNDGEQVEMMTLDYFGLRNLDYLKIDCEGYELFVLEGAERTLIENRPVIVIERKAKHVKRYRQHNNDATTFLNKLGAKLRNKTMDDWIYAWSYLPDKPNRKVYL